MIWAFHRSGQRVRCEVRREPDGDGYELAVTRPDGVEEVERFDNASALIETSIQRLGRLRDEGWKPVSAVAAF